MKVLDLFSGIGGFSLGLERAGMETVAFCEFDKKAQLVLKKHWPGVPIYNDVRGLNGEQVKRDIGTVDLICGGFPCQDISQANSKGEGLGGGRSGLFWEAYRIIAEIKPRWIILENVANLLNRGMGEVLGALAEIRYDAEWHCIRASRFGLPSHRDRIWIIAYPYGANLEGVDFSQSFLAHPEESCRRELTRAVDAAIPANDYTNLFRDRAWLSSIMEQLKQYGNSVAPVILETIGKEIMEIVRG